MRSRSAGAVSQTRAATHERATRRLTPQHRCGGQATLAEGWDGVAWAVQSTPNPSGAAQPTLAGVSCPSATDCMAAGTYNGDEGTLAERYN